MTKILVNINPNILRWAREEARYSQKELADKLGIEDARYQKWELEGKEIPFGKLDALSNTLKRQIAFFFLPEAPHSPPLPTDHRNRTHSGGEISKEVAFALRQTQYFRDTALELRSTEFWESAYGWEQELVAFPESKADSIPKMADWLRQRLEIDLDTQLRWKAEHDALKAWRRAVEEKLGILVFQFRMEKSELDGFCLTNFRPHAIVLNSSQVHSKRIFTLFHELAHIFRRQSGLCLIDAGQASHKPEERACDQFAGTFLAPANELLPVDSIEELQTFAAKFKISREAYLWRLKEEGLIPDNLFLTLRNKVIMTYQESEATKAVAGGGFSPPPETKSKSVRGETLFNLVLDALQTNRISYAQAAGVLDLRMNKIASIL